MTVFSIYGAGEMGSEIAVGMVERGDRVLVHDPFSRREWPGSELSKESVAQAADVHLICVRGVETATEVLLGDDGIVRHARPEGLVVMMTTMPPEDARHISAEAATLGFDRVVDGAMSRRATPIAARGLTVLLGSRPDDAPDAITACSVFAENVVAVGGPGAGMAAKLLNNWLLQSNRWALVRAARAAGELGVGIDEFVGVINKSSGGSWVSNQWGAAERALLDGQPVDDSLRERTKSEVEMLAESMAHVQAEFSIEDVLELVAHMKGR